MIYGRGQRHGPIQIILVGAEGNTLLDLEKILPLRIATMYKVYGKVEGKICKTCYHLINSRGYIAKTVYKCTNSKMTHGSATDWRVGWQACGLYKEGSDSG